MICLTIVALAYTSIRRIGSFVLKSKAAAASFSWIVPRYVRFLGNNYTFLVWIPFNKSDPQGRGTTLVVKRTKDECCPVTLLHRLITSRSNEGPLFINHQFIPTQPSMLRWIRFRMEELGRDPRIYSLRSIRQGASSMACEAKMPEVFLRASGGWKGDAMELYRKDRLPAAQEDFAEALGRSSNVVLHQLSHHGHPQPARLSRVIRRGSNRGANFPAAFLPDPTRRSCERWETGKRSKASSQGVCAQVRRCEFTSSAVTGTESPGEKRLVVQVKEREGGVRWGWPTSAGLNREGVLEEDSDCSNINQPLFLNVSQENYNVSYQAFVNPPSSEAYTMSTDAKSVYARNVPLPVVEKISNPTLPDPEGTRKRRLMSSDPPLICTSRDKQKDQSRFTKEDILVDFSTMYNKC